MRILFLNADMHYDGVDLRQPRYGNPGMGGTEYLFGALAYELSQQDGCAVTVLCAAGAVQYPEEVATIAIDLSDRQALVQAVADCPHDVLILRGGGDRFATDLISDLPASSRTLVWAHNFIGRSLLRRLIRTPKVRAIVSVGHEQHALQQHLQATDKAVAVPNFIYDQDDGATLAFDRTPRAIYIGALNESKGFHYLARYWPAIRAQVPDAQLDVIGSGGLYGTAGSMGPRGLAADGYESKFIQELGDDPDAAGVVFHGRVSDMVIKNNLLAGAKLGLPNPTGTTETFCLSAIEMILAGCTVLAPQRWGFMDTVTEGVTGQFFTTSDQFVDRAVEVLTGAWMTAERHAAAVTAVVDAFDYTRIIPQWLSLLERVVADQPAGDGTVDPVRGTYPLAFRYRLPRLGGLRSMFSGMVDRRYRKYLRR